MEEEEADKAQEITVGDREDEVPMNGVGEGGGDREERIRQWSGERDAQIRELQREGANIWDMLREEEGGQVRQEAGLEPNDENEGIQIAEDGEVQRLTAAMTLEELELNGISPDIAARLQRNREEQHLSRKGTESEKVPPILASLADEAPLLAEDQLDRAGDLRAVVRWREERRRRRLELEAEGGTPPAAEQNRADREDSARARYEYDTDARWPVPAPVPAWGPPPAPDPAPALQRDPPAPDAPRRPRYVPPPLDLRFIADALELQPDEGAWFGRGDGGGRGGMAITQELVREAQTFQEKDENAPSTSRFSRACPVCVVENPHMRAVFIQCGHIVCLPCAVQNARTTFPTLGKCVFCRKESGFIKLFEENEDEKNVKDEK